MTISVIVPIYKVEAYLRQCVDSVLAQTYTDLDIVLVDDGSPTTARPFVMPMPARTRGCRWCISPMAA